VDERTLDAAALVLDERDRTGSLFAGFPDGLAPRTEAVAYAIQGRAAELRAARRATTAAGHKIGSTTPVMQAYLAISSPCSGIMLADTVVGDGAEFEVPPHGVLGVECELAVRLGRDLPARDEPYTRDELAHAVSSCMAAIEVVEDRYVDWRTLDAPTLIADDFFHVGAVLGEERADVDPRDLHLARGSMRLDGSVVGSGTGADVLGHPLAALGWLADSGAGLRAGEVVMLGSLVETNWVAAGMRVRIDNEPLGPVEVTFQAGA